ncbi:MAG TPA: hypothetical protein VNV43_13160 [Candidatus Acidoferrales bacterium]|jgi:hypothetical protein|nr:hypothetical protein [Candidatus Acidoferrales bacterium]
MNDDTDGNVQEEIQDRTPPAVRARDIIFSDRKLSPGAKFFAAWIIDNSYNAWRGGDSRGRLTIAVRDIRKLIGHDKKSINRWNKELHHHIWLEKFPLPNAHPVNVYCVRELVPGHEQMEINGLARAWGRVRGDRGKFAPSSSLPFLAQNGKSTSQSPINPPPMTQNLHLAGPQDATSQVATCHLAGPQDATSQVATFPLGGGKNGSSEVATFPLGGGKNGSCEVAKTGHLKETPKENRRHGDKECVRPGPTRAASHTPLPRFEPLDVKMAHRLRKPWGDDVIERLKSKIFRMENARQPLANQKEIIAVYKSRISEIKDWMTGELSGEPKTAAKAAART